MIDLIKDFKELCDYNAEQFTELICYTLNFYKELLPNFRTYDGYHGSRALAIEYGHGLARYPEKEREKEIARSYDSICIKFYGKSPEINKEDWVSYVRKGIDKAVSERLRIKMCKEFYS